VKLLEQFFYKKKLKLTFAHFWHLILVNVFIRLSYGFLYFKHKISSSFDNYSAAMHGDFIMDGTHGLFMEIRSNSLCNSIFGAYLK